MRALRCSPGDGAAGAAVVRAELRVETCGSSRGSACLAVSPCANVHVIVLGAVLCACELSLGISECIRANYRLGRVCYVKGCYQVTHGFTRPLYTCSSLTRCALLGSKSAWLAQMPRNSSGQCATRLSRRSGGTNGCRAAARTSAIMGISGAAGRAGIGSAKVYQKGRCAKQRVS